MNDQAMTGAAGEVFEDTKGHLWLIVTDHERREVRADRLGYDGPARFVFQGKSMCDGLSREVRNHVRETFRLAFGGVL